MNWHNAKKGEPCPICGHNDWCSISNDGEVCVCRRMISPYPTKGGTGWIHPLKARSTDMPYCPSAPTRTYYRDFALVHNAYEAKGPQFLAAADKLGVSHQALKALDARYNPQSHALSFPMRNVEGVITGLRYRHVLSGQKWSERGSKDGLFFDPTFLSSSIVIVEGPSDTAVALSMGLCVVGRSSCMSGGNELVRLINKRQIKAVKIIADNDPPKRRADGSIWSPGYEGAKALRALLTASTPAKVALAFPDDGHKDLRESHFHLAPPRVTKNFS